jgi:SAM-dependent methyltransferase
VLDVGCGRGRNTFYLSQKGFATYACDLSPVAIAVAKAQALQIDATISFQVADLTDLPYPDNSFAAVACVHVLPYHFKASIAKGVRELRRVLRPDGWLYFDLLGCDDAEYGCGRELEEHTFLDPDGVPIHFSSRQEVDELLDGFAVERKSQFELGSPARTRVGWVVWARKC